jgi:hypothetical protein
MMKLVLILLSILCISCSDSNGYTLYRNSVAGADMRIHVASFDSTDGDDYNRINCQIAQELFQKQNGVQTNF